MFRPRAKPIVYALAPGAKIISASAIGSESAGVGRLETLNVATSAGSLGTVFGVQFVAVLQSPPFVGLTFHVALPAKAVLAIKNRSNRTDRPAQLLGDEVVFMADLNTGLREYS